MTRNNQQRDELSAQRFASLSRRRFLRGVGACMAVPALESLLPARGLHAAAAVGAPLAVSSTGAPLRMAYVYFPNGAHQGNWWPTGGEKDFQLGKTLGPLE